MNKLLEKFIKNNPNIDRTIVTENDSGKHKDSKSVGNSENKNKNDIDISEKILDDLYDNHDGKTHWSQY
jgi:hypothetical protein